ncbi:MAG: polyhydroxyalkanoate synthesis repressor PhaR [Gammaproteobacteria bacterium]|nr:polyhydroxyalkanoate synthesis repressor PhaR [Gammaproteobacteria bacterium]
MLPEPPLWAYGNIWEGSAVSQSTESGQEPITIKKYANRRLYNTATSTYVTLEDLANMVKEGNDFLVYDAKSGEDITRSVLTQIIFEEESKGQNLLPINFLRQLIGFYGDSMQALVPSYLEVSLENLSREQEKFREHMSETFGAHPIKAMEQLTKQNIAMFENAMGMFTPFGADKAESPKTETPPEPERSTDDLQTLQQQLQAMQKQLDDLAKKS